MVCGFLNAGDGGERDFYYPIARIQDKFGIFRWRWRKPGSEPPPPLLPNSYAKKEYSPDITDHRVVSCNSIKYSGLPASFIFRNALE
jgi:hypothetical protein